jgi:hypothetical protein
MVVSNALRGLTDAMRKERLARLSYQGESWEADGKEHIQATEQARQAFERALNRFVDILARA